MEIGTIKLAAIAFAQTGQYREALRVGNLLPGNESRDRLFAGLAGYYLQQARMLRPRRKSVRDVSTWNKIVEYLQAASLTTAEIKNYNTRTTKQKLVARLGLGYLKEKEVPIPRITEVINVMTKGICSPTSALILGTDSFAHEVINAYLKISDVKGEVIFEISECLRDDSRYAEAKRLMEIFIHRGDFDALKAVGGKYVKLKDELMNRAEEIIQACLKNNNLNGAIEALSWIVDTSKRFNFAELLGVDLKSDDKKRK